MKNKGCIKIKEYVVTNNSDISTEQIAVATKAIIDVLPNYNVSKPITLEELDGFLILKYKAEKAHWKDIDKCTLTKIRKYNKYCKTVFCISEGLVSDDEYYSSYIIKRENCIDPSTNKDDYFNDVFIIVGSSDKVHPTSYFVGGHSGGLLEEMQVLIGK